MKKKVDKMPIQKEKFIKGCMAQGMDRAEAENVMSLLETFARYGFNISHACSYATLSVQTAYLRAHYMTEFMTALITYEDEPDKTQEYLADAHSHGIKLLPPSINVSTHKLVADGEAIRFGLTTVKNVGGSAYEAILKDREQNGPYQSFEDFIFRVYGQPVTKSVVESLARSGALDGFGLTRKQMAECIPEISKAFGSYKNKLKTIDGWYDKMMGWDDIAKIEKKREELEERKRKAETELHQKVSEAITSIQDEYSSVELAQFESELLGYYVLHHPLDEYKDYFYSLSQRQEYVVTSSNFKNYRNEKVVVCGMVQSVKKRKTQYGQRLDAQIVDWDGSLQITLYNASDKRLSEVLREGNVVTVTGRVIHYDKSGFTFVRVDNAELASKEPLPTKALVYVDDDKVEKVIEAIKKTYDMPWDIVPGEECGVIVRASKREIELDVEIYKSDAQKMFEIDGVFQVLVV